MATGYRNYPADIGHPEDLSTLRFEPLRIEEVAGSQPNDLDREVALILGNVLAAGGGDW